MKKPPNIILMHKKSKKKLKCYFCGGPHLCRDCNVERKKSPEMKKKSW